MNTQKIADLLHKLAATASHEPRTGTHDNLPKLVAPVALDGFNEGSKVLDVGCGSGPFLELCRERGIEAIGITVDLVDLSACIGHGYKAHQMDMHDLQFRDEEFGLVWARHSLEHSPFPLLALSEFKRVLAPGGRLYVEVPAPGTWCNHESNPNHYSIFTDKAWQWLFEKAGFDLVDLKFVDVVLDGGKDQYFSYLLAAKTEGSQ